MNLLQAVILSAFIALVIAENYGYGYWMFSRPVVGGFLVGLVMGDIQTGLFVGGTIELMYMGVLPIGGSVPPNAQIAGMLSTVFAILNGGNAELGITLALPIGLLAQLLIMLAWNINIALMHAADVQIENGNVKGVERIHLLGLPIFFAVFFVASFLAIYFGSDVVKTVVDKLPDVILNGMKIASGIIPAVGMAMLLKMMNFKKYWAFFILGFVLSVYLGLNVLAVSMIAFTAICGMYALEKQEDVFDDFADDVVEDAEPTQTLLTNGDLRRVFARSFFSMTSINYERYTSLGFCYAMIPAIKRLYNTDEEIIAALKRHNEFFNCHPYTGNAVIGVTLALEEQRALGKPITDEAISSTKTALMGPLSGIGDSVFKAVFMTIFAAIGAGLALEGNIIGPFVFLIPNVILNVASRWLFIKYGRSLGTMMISKMKDSKIIDKFVQGATVVGMMVVGAMSVGFVKVPIALAWTIGEVEIVLLDILNSIMPSLLPLLIVLLYYVILKKSKYGMFICFAITFILGILGVAVGIF